ncbi:MAG TPA: LysR family transcriptional regulator [Rhodospirillales bacterium]
MSHRDNLQPLDEQGNDGSTPSWDGFEAPLRYDWHDIVFFLELVRHGQLVGAAKRLKVNHTTVSRRIRELERSLKTKLFSRTKSGFVLTEAGLKILEHAEAMEYQANSIAQAVGIEGEEAGGAVRIATMEGIGSFYLGPRIKRFHDLHPAVLIELVTSSGLINLSRREADIFISFPRPAERRLSVRKIGEFQVGLFASSAYLGRRGVPERKAELEGHDFVDYIDDMIQIQAVRWLTDVVVPRNVVFRSTSLIAQYTSASMGLGIAMLPTFVAAHNPDLKRVLPKLSATRDIWLSVHEDLLHTSKINAVIRFITDQVRRDQDFLLGQ